MNHMTNPTTPQPDAAEVAKIEKMIDEQISSYSEVSPTEIKLAAQAIASHYHSILQQKDAEIERLNKMYEVDMRIFQKEKIFLSKGMRESAKIIEDKDDEITDLKMQLKIYQND